MRRRVLPSGSRTANIGGTAGPIRRTSASASTPRARRSAWSASASRVRVVSLLPCLHFLWCSPGKTEAGGETHRLPRRSTGQGSSTGRTLPDAALGRFVRITGPTRGRCPRCGVRRGRSSRPSAPAGKAHSCHHLGESGRFTGLSRSEMESQGPATGIGREVDLRGQPAAGSADGMVAWLPGKRPFLPAPAACWWARTIVES
jgi:hypothetical protein